jgi:hypothetical protein
VIRMLALIHARQRVLIPLLVLPIVKLFIRVKFPCVIHRAFHRAAQPVRPAGRRGDPVLGVIKRDIVPRLEGCKYRLVNRRQRREGVEGLRRQDVRQLIR